MSLAKPSFPPLDGSLTAMPGFVDFHVANNPDSSFAIWPSPDSPSGLSGITYLELMKATHRVAHKFRPGRRGRDGEIVAIVAHTDTVLYCTLIIGCIRAGLVPYPMSPRNSAAAICSMMEKSSVHRIIVEPSVSSIISEVRDGLSKSNHVVEIIDMPGLYDAFPDLRAGAQELDTFEFYPEPDRQISFDDVALILHSSGSTGFPKPISIKHRFLLNIARSDCIDGCRQRGLLWFSGALPSFHAFGFIWQLMLPLSSGTPTVHFSPAHPAPPVVPNPENTLETSRAAGCTALPAVPAFVESWTRSDDAVFYLRSLKSLFYAGGPLSKKCGDELVNAGVILTSIYAATEFGLPTPIFYAEKDRVASEWDWVQIGKRFKPRWEPQGDGTYELQFLTCETHQPAIENLPDVPGYATSDLFTPHPTKPHLWKVTGRKDDVIVLASAEKIVPLPQEGHVLSSPMVKGAIIFGRGREQAGMLIEPAPQYELDPNDEPALVTFRNSIWPVVDQANRLAPAFARIFKEMIIVTDPAKPFPRVAKGTVNRKQVYALYDSAISKLYETVENSTNARETRPPTSWDLPELEEWLVETAMSVNDNETVEATLDLFQQGFDSLTATFLRTRIIAALRMTNQMEAARLIPQNFIFDHPTIQQLALATHLIVSPDSIEARATTGLLQQTRDVVARYTADMPHRSTTWHRRSRGGIVVLLTGSTGALGSHILAVLLGDDRVSKVFTLDRLARSPDSPDRLPAAFKDRGLPMDLLSHRKLIRLTGNFNEVNLGVDKNVFDELKNSVTSVVHNAWAVHFSHSLPFFEELIAGTRKLIDFGLSLSRPVRILFTSSVSTARSWDPEQGLVPEDVVPDNGISPENGYAASKYVVEQIIKRARCHGLDASSLRIGQLCGSRDAGAWNSTDWLPIMLKSSLTVGAFPDTLGAVNWIPLDSVAKLVLDLLVLEEKPRASVFNVVHPRPITWQQTFQDINAALNTSLPLIPMEEWVSRIAERSTDATQKTLEDIPAIKLLDFFNGIIARSTATSDRRLLFDSLGFAMFETAEMERCSQTIRDLLPLDAAYAKAWIRYWKERNVL